MRYRLVLITHGDAPALDRVVEAFEQNVTPAPAERLAIIDGSGSRLPVGVWNVSPSLEQRGFCEATRAGWTAGAESSFDYVFWLENDFLITRTVDLALLAAVLDANSQLAQMQLMRNAVNEQERAAGGLYESRPGQYESRVWREPFVRPASYAVGVPIPGREHHWLRHRAYLTTNPCLMRRDFMAENPWPDYPEQCEGRFGIDLVAAGFSFGVWGDGQPWCEHVGIRDGFGY